MSVLNHNRINNRHINYQDHGSFRAQNLLIMTIMGTTNYISEALSTGKR